MLHDKSLLVYNSVNTALLLIRCTQYWFYYWVIINLILYVRWKHGLSILDLLIGFKLVAAMKYNL